MSNPSMQGYLEHRGTFLVIILGIFLPLYLWSLDASLPHLFNNPYNTWTTLAQTTGLMSLSLYAINILLSARYHAVDRLFFGLDRAYRIHRFTGITAFSLMLIHVTSVTLRSASLSIADLQTLWLDFSQLPFVFGRLSFFGFASIILITLLVKRLSYEKLKLLHQTLGVFLLLGGIHAYLIPSTIAVNLPLRLYVLGLAATGIASYLIRTVFKKWLVPRREFAVEAVRRLTPEITEVVMSPALPGYTFLPGQFNFYRFQQAGFPAEDHPFSITGGAGAKKLRLSAKKLGDFTAHLPELKPGARAFVQGPFGGFTYLRGSRRQIWIAGGIGITPFISMARSLSSPPANQYEITLIYSVPKATEAVYREELDLIQNRLPGINFHLWITDQNGFLDAAGVNAITGLTNCDIFICGPPAMVYTLKRQFLAAGIPRRRLKSELFKLL